MEPELRTRAVKSVDGWYLPNVPGSDAIHGDAI